MGDPTDMPLDVPEHQRAEYEGVRALLVDHARSGDRTAVVHADAIARAALKPGHLWRAMELPSRDALRSIFAEHFPALYAANDKDMRWKKFLHKRLCGWEGFQH